MLPARLDVIVATIGSACISSSSPTVWALVRTDDERAAALRRAGAEVFLSTLDDIRDLRKTMRNVQRAYFLAPSG